MMKVTWLTDLHLNFATEQQIQELAASIESSQADIVLVGGDIAEATDFDRYLDDLSQLVSSRIYFVLGNHDYYHGSIDGVRNRARTITETTDRLRWLPASGVEELTSQTALVGHGGWGDARVGEFLDSDVLLNDYLLIKELAATHGFPNDHLVLTRELKQTLQFLGDEAAQHFARVVPLALQSCRHLIVLMHVPPFHDACWHEGKLSDLNWTPHFVCEAAGTKLREIMLMHPEHRMTVLCGHTHSGGYVEVLDNLEVYTGAAVYRAPEIQSTFDVE